MLLLLLLFLTGYCFSASDSSAVKGGAKPIVPHQYPWLLGVRIKASGFFENTTCGASLLPIRDGLLESDMALAAAHCLIFPRDIFIFAAGTYIPKALITITAGDHSLTKNDSTEQKVQVAEMVNHENYDRESNNNDIAVIKLAQPVLFNEVIQPVKLARKGDTVKQGSKCTVAGWGYIDNVNIPDVPYHINLTVWSDDFCTRKHNSSYNASNMLCASPGENLPGHCLYDSGSALLCPTSDDNKLTAFGIVSFGGGGDCESRQLPGGYTKVSSFEDWIEEKVRKMTSL